ncbi:BofC N-terminal domain-containing protein [Alteribacillus sp. HJP-4]|uniref:BofC N-terminal domain-containing protein n=1 Tax=Alteribacillus sp. HJP-4 TaxID=2775394 RepID=UPI0035CD388F
MKHLLMSFSAVILTVGIISINAHASGQKDESWSTGSPMSYDIILETEHPDGTVTTSKEVKEVWSVDDFWSEYEEYELINMTNDTIFFRKNHPN